MSNSPFFVWSQKKYPSKYFPKDWTHRKTTRRLLLLVEISWERTRNSWSLQRLPKFVNLQKASKGDAIKFYLLWTKFGSIKVQKPRIFFFRRFKFLIYNFRDLNVLFLLFLNYLLCIVAFKWWQRVFMRLVSIQLHLLHLLLPYYTISKSRTQTQTGLLSNNHHNDIRIES